MDYQDKLKGRLENMRLDASKMATKYGIGEGTHNGPQDAFRHAYISAKVTRDEGGLYAQAMGTGNEYLREVQKRFETKGMEGNPSGEWNMDELNNMAGREIGRKAKEEGWDDDRIAQEVKKAMENGKLVEHPREPDERTITPTKPNGLRQDDNTTYASILDYYINRKIQKVQEQESDDSGFLEYLFGR